MIAEDGFVYCEIQRGMYGLKQAAILAYTQLKENLLKHGYYPICNSNGLWRHESRQTIFALCVDDFGVKYYNEDDANHLINVLKKYYPISLDREGKNYCGLTIHWHYDEGYVDVEMPNYVTKKLQNFQHPTPTKPQYAPHVWNKPAYGKQTQYAPEPDRTNFLDAKRTKLVQSIVGAFLYYARAMDPTILPALNEISTQQSKPTEKNLGKNKNAFRLHGNISECPAPFCSRNNAIDGGFRCSLFSTPRSKIKNRRTLHVSFETQQV